MSDTRLIQKSFPHSIVKLKPLELDSIQFNSGLNPENKGIIIGGKELNHTYHQWELPKHPLPKLFKISRQIEQIKYSVETATY